MEGREEERRQRGGGEGREEGRRQVGGEKAGRGGRGQGREVEGREEG